MEAARVAARRGHDVELIERADQLGGLATVTGPAADLARWQADECATAGVQIRTGVHEDAASLAGQAARSGSVVIQCTGAQPGRRTYTVDGDATIIDVEVLRRGDAELPETGIIAVLDPIGGPIGVAIAEQLGDRAVLITPDQIAGNELSRTGDLAPANVRLAQRGTQIVRRAIVRHIGADGVVVEDRFSGEQRTIDAVAAIDCGFRLPTDTVDAAQLHAGDCVAPRTILEAVLEGRRAAIAIDGIGG